MIKNKGFTLLELLGVIAILGILILIAVPNINNSISKAKDETFNSYKKNLYIACETYVETNREKYPELGNIGGEIIIKVDDLIKDKLISEKIHNPYTKREITGLEKIRVTVKDDKSLNYEYEGE